MSVNISIFTQKQQYFSGETVTGVARLEVTKAISVDAINMKAVGEEKCKYSYQEGRSTVTCRGEKKVLEHRVAFLNQPGTLQPGAYDFPFEFVIPPRAPGTFLIDQFMGVFRGSVHYEIRVEVVRPGFFDANLKQAQPFFVCAPLRAPIKPAEDHTDGKVVVCCCVNKGQVSVTAMSDRDAVMPGEPMNLRVIVDNTQSSLDMKHCKAELFRVIMVPGGGSMGSDFIYKESVAKINSIGTIKKGQVLDIQEMLLTSPQMEPTMIGLVYDCVYELKVWTTAACAADIIARIPVTVYIPSFQPPVQPVTGSPVQPGMGSPAPPMQPLMTPMAQNEKHAAPPQSPQSPQSGPQSPQPPKS